MFWQKYRHKCFPWVHLHIIWPTVVYHVMQGCCAETTTTPQIFSMTCEEYHSLLTDGDDKNTFPCSLWALTYGSRSEPDGLRQTFCQKFRLDIFVSRLLPYGKAYSRSRHNLMMFFNVNNDSTDVQLSLQRVRQIYHSRESQYNVVRSLNVKHDSTSLQRAYKGHHSSLTVLVHGMM